MREYIENLKSLTAVMKERQVSLFPQAAVSNGMAAQQPVQPLASSIDAAVLSFQQSYPQSQSGMSLQPSGQPETYTPTQAYIEQSALIRERAQAEIECKRESAVIECAKLDAQDKRRENRRIKRQAQVDRVELSPEGVPVVRYELVELPDFKCYLADCRFEPFIIRPDDKECSDQDSILMVCAGHDRNIKKIYFRVDGLTGKRFRRKLMQKGIKILAPAKKANDLADLLIQVLINEAQEVRVPRKLGWNIHDSRVTYVKEGEWTWEAVEYYVENY